MLTAIVIPCLNERELITRTADSLGFGTQHPPLGSFLVLVDNGSKDGSLDVLKEIQREAGSSAVIVAEEPDRGYVPPRAKGIEIAAQIAYEQNVPPNQLLILQADADTIYSKGYVTAFQAAARKESRSAMFEGTTHPPHRFLGGHPGFQRLADEVDVELAPCLVDDTLDVIVDDKVAGYTLSSYRQWGGLRREFLTTGSEIHAETSRLFIRAKLSQAIHVRVSEAEAIPSRRKILRNPIRHFATGGFPRDETWWRRWSRSYQGPRDLNAFEGDQARESLKQAVATREAHMLGLFSLLPLLMTETAVRAEHLDSDYLHPLVRQRLALSNMSFAAADVPSIFEFMLSAVDEWTALPCLI
ncbi:glycosyltransferase family 2 protein [Rhizobium sp.]|uniref:glycosyltransferase family 2 protein n=1 Tax=Rhizobium sp. TaxID=391 RepID=UPI002AA6719C